MNTRPRVDNLALSMALFAALALVGWYAEDAVLAAAAIAGLAVAAAVRSWSHRCLSEVQYLRAVGATRALFGEEVGMTVELRNQKLLPLTWLHVEDQVPQLPIRGGVVNEFDAYPTLVQLTPMLPYQVVKRRLTVICDRRGAHIFGPSRLRSGDPIGYREQSRRIEGTHELLVYPKVFALNIHGIAAGVPLGPAKARMLVEDPTRAVGVREYRPGDSLRAVDWRATARSRSAMVRVCEPSGALRVALALDTKVPQLRWPVYDPPQAEFAIALAASVLSALGAAGVSAGLFSTATVEGHPIAHAPGTDCLPDALESLARASPLGDATMGDILLSALGASPQGTSVLVIAAAFPASTLIALSELRRRRLSLTGIFILTEHDGEPVPGPPTHLFDSLMLVRFSEDWVSVDEVDIVVA